MKDDFSIPFDQYQRYALLAQLLEPLTDSNTRILEVGANNSHLRKFLQEATIWLLDLNPDEQPDFIRSDAVRLPVLAGAADYVVSADVFEHINLSKRDTFLSEAWRASKKGTILGFPFRSDRNTYADRALHLFLKNVLKIDSLHLTEHEANPLPDKEETLEAIQRFAPRYVHATDHGNTDARLLMLSTFHLLSKTPGTEEIRDYFSEVYNRTLFSSDRQTPCYRTFIIALKYLPDPEVAERIEKLETPFRSEQELLAAMAFTSSLLLSSATQDSQEQFKIIREDLIHRIHLLEMEVSRLQHENGEKEVEISTLKWHLNRFHGNPVIRLYRKVKDLLRLP